MNIGFILAGGLGLRMKMSSSLPKQFSVLGERPILMHTIERFEAHKNIDCICVVCLETWEHYLTETIQSYNFKKVRWIVSGGETRQQSVYNGLCALENDCSSDDIVVVHDGVRPFITNEVISQNIELALMKKSAMTGYRSTDTLVTSPNGKNAASSLDRDTTFTIQTPQTYRLGYGLKQYRRAYAADMVNTVNCCELFIKLGERIHIVNGLKTNIKLTTEDDIAYIEALNKIFHEKSN